MSRKDYIMRYRIKLGDTVRVVFADNGEEQTHVLNLGMSPNGVLQFGVEIPSVGRLWVDDDGDVLNNNELKRQVRGVR
jgi:hypothetical protein